MLFEDHARNTSAGKQTDVIRLDFAKAYDKVKQSKLLWKLHLNGIRGNALSWIRAFLVNRFKTVFFAGEESRSVPVTSGVPGIKLGTYPVHCIYMKSYNHKRPSLLMTWPFTSQLDARTIELL